MAYLGFDVLVLWSAFLAIHAHPVPGFAVVIMAYIIGALGGSIPLPAALGTIGGIAGMLILYGVDAQPRGRRRPAPPSDRTARAADSAVAIAYTILHRRLGPIRTSAYDGQR